VVDHVKVPVIAVHVEIVQQDNLVLVLLGVLLVFGEALGQFDPMTQRHDRQRQAVEDLLATLVENGHAEVATHGRIAMAGVMMIVDAASAIAEEYARVAIEADDAGVSGVVAFPLPGTVGGNGLGNVTVYLGGF